MNPYAKIILDFLRSVADTRDEQYLESSWWNRLWPAWAGAFLMITSILGIRLATDPKYKEWLEKFTSSGSWVGIGFLLSILTISLVVSLLFTPNHSLNRPRRFCTAAAIPVLLLATCKYLES